jgi:hypothetical protein
VQDASNGSVCHSVYRNDTTGSGLQDFGGSYLIHIPSNTWTPPDKTAQVTPSAVEVSDAKYAISYSPSTATQYLHTEGFYASVQWY